MLIDLIPMRCGNKTRDIDEEMYVTHINTVTGGFVIEALCMPNKYTERTIICLSNTVHKGR